MPKRSARAATAAIAGLAATVLLAPARAQDVSLQNGDLRFVLSGGGNVKLFVSGIPVIRESHLYIVKPGWTGALMNQDQVPGKTSSFEEDGVKVGLATYETENAWSKYRYEIHPDRTYRVTVTYGVKGGQPADVEYSAAAHFMIALLCVDTKFRCINALKISRLVSARKASGISSPSIISQWIGINASKRSYRPSRFT